jgi:hypothetical protein
MGVGSAEIPDLFVYVLAGSEAVFDPGSPCGFWGVSGGFIWGLREEGSWGRVQDGVRGPIGIFSGM